MSSSPSLDPQKINFHPTDTREDTLRKIRTADSVAIPLDVFEKLYLNPQQPAAGPLRKTFGNPTPVALVGFLIAATPNACALMEWRGAGGGGVALLCVFIFFGGMLQIIGGTLEFFLGNYVLERTLLHVRYVYPSDVIVLSLLMLILAGAFWLVQGTSLQPFYAVGTNYSATGNALEGATTPGYFATTAFYLLFMALLSFIFMVCSLRTNVVLFSALLFLVIAFGSLAGTCFQLALGSEALVGTLQICGSVFVFILSMCVWYLLFAQMLESVDFPFSLPVGDLSSVIPGKSVKRPNEGHVHVD